MICTTIAVPRLEFATRTPGKTGKGREGEAETKSLAYEGKQTNIQMQQDRALSPQFIQLGAADEQDRIVQDVNERCRNDVSECRNYF